MFQASSVRVTYPHANTQQDDNSTIIIIIGVFSFILIKNIFIVHLNLVNQPTKWTVAKIKGPKMLNDVCPQQPMTLHLKIAIRCNLLVLYQVAIKK